MSVLQQLAAAAAQEPAPSGIAALGLNVQSFVFQLLSFGLLLLLLRKFVYQKLVDTLESRRQAVIDSLDDAKKAAEELEKSNQRNTEIMKQAQKEAAEMIALAKTEAAAIASDAEAKARKRADHLVEQAENRIQQDMSQAREALRKEMVQLVADATEKVLGEKVDSASDKKLIAKALKERQ